MTPYGSAVISENEKEYIIDLTPVVGRVIRVGGFLGRIVDADGKMFTLDFGNPFGGEKIFCDVTALGIAERGKDDAADHLKVQPVSENLSDSSQITAPVSEEGTLASKSVAGTPAEMSTEGAANGDLLVFDFSLRNGDGELIMTSRQSDDADTAIKKSDSYEQPEFFAPAELILGKREIVPFIEKALYGMKSGEMKDVHIAPKDAYGERDPGKVKTFPLVKALPEEIRITREEFKNRFKFDPEAGKQIQVVPIFMSEVASVEGDQVVIKHIVDDGKNIPGELGFTEILRRDGKIIMTLAPIVGATIDVKGERGVITGSNKTGFDVDFNPAHAGESFSLDVAVQSIVKQAQFRKEIPWKAGLNEVLESSDQRHKPAVLVLYADWCGWSKKLLTETLTDPRITSQADHFLWCKIDTDQEKDIYALYEQTSYPMVVLLKGNGDVLKKLDGFVNAVTLSRELRGLL
jgi:FKBP-type peptidyl-prolyl cis-trans isomerase 2